MQGVQETLTQQNVALRKQVLSVFGNLSCLKAVPPPKAAAPAAKGGGGGRKGSGGGGKGSGREHTPLSSGLNSGDSDGTQQDHLAVRACSPEVDKADLTTDTKKRAKKR